MTRIAQIGPVLVGGVLLLAGVAKALEPHYFVRHLLRMDFLPTRWLRGAMTLFIGAQSALGVALMVSLWPGALIPVAIGFVLALGLATYVSAVRGNLDDCGCYNGLVDITPHQSLLLDFVYVLLLVPALLHVPRGPVSSTVALWVALGIGAALASLAHVLASYYSRHNELLVDLSPMKVGRPWRPGWLGREATPLRDDDEETIVAFMEAGCQQCERWAKVLSFVHKTPGLPSVQGVVGGANPQVLDEFLAAKQLLFPVVVIPSTTMKRLVRASIPTGVLVEEGTIREKWRGSISPAFIERIRSHHKPASHG